MQKTIQSENAPRAIGPYSPAVKIGDFILLSGQLPIDPATGRIVEGGIAEQTAQCIRNMKALLEESGIGLEYVLKTTVFLTDLNDFAEMNKVYGEYFSEPYPARSAAEVSKLAMGAKVEIEAYAIDTRALEVICSQEGCSSCSDKEGCEL